MLLAFSIGIIVFSIWILGAFVLARSNKLEVNKTFAIFIILMGFWIVANSVDNNYTKNILSVEATRLDFFAGPLLAYSFWYFTDIFKSQVIQKNKKSILTRVLFYTSFITAFLSLSNLFVSAKFIDHKLSAQYSNFYFLYSIILGLVAFLGIINLVIAYKKAKGILKNQAAIMLLGLLVTVVFIVAANLVVPLLTPSKSINLYTGNSAYLGLVFFISSSTYAILKHKLFDIKAAVARSVVYLFTLAAITFIYAVPTVLIAVKLLHAPLKFPTIAILVVVTFVAAIAYQPLKTRFTRFTSKLFYRDYYELQDVLNQLSNLLVVSVDLGKITSGSKSILTKALHPGFVNYALLNGPENNQDTQKLLNVLNKAHDGMIITDEMDQTRQLELYNTLHDQNISAAVRLRTSKGELGFMLLGYKQSGSIYNDVDKRLLTISADEIAIGLQNALHVEEIQQFNVTLQQKIEEATHKLRQANERLKQIDETKDDFISMASHQLRTPLTSMKGYVSMVLEGDSGKISKMQKELLSQAFGSAQKMVYLIADLLNVSRLKSGKFVIENTPTNLSDMVQDEIGQLTETAANRQLALTFDKPKTFPSLMLDETKIRQVIMNFIDNAIYYTPKDGHINVKLEDKPDSIDLTVNDDGIGVPKAEQHHLFTKFYRAGNAKQARPDGTGIGLFMAQKVVIAQGGAVIFHSEEGKGSTFGFTMPKNKATIPPAVSKSPANKPTDKTVEKTPEKAVA